VSLPTVSEDIFEQLCANKGIECTRIQERAVKSADYFVSSDKLSMVVEIKQLDPNDEDKELLKVWGSPDSPGSEAPSNRVQGLLEDGYPQIKRSSEGKWPTMIVVYNNSGPWNWIDTWTVSKAMFGLFGFVYGLTSDNSISVTGHGYFGQRKLTKDTFRNLSVVGVLKVNGTKQIALSCYHNPFALMPVEPILLGVIADEQYIHPDPHNRGFVPWEPKKIET
jgi:hypothetical protein